MAVVWGGLRRWGRGCGRGGYLRRKWPGEGRAPEHYRPYAKYYCQRGRLGQWKGRGRAGLKVQIQSQGRPRGDSSPPKSV